MVSSTPKQTENIKKKGGWDTFILLLFCTLFFLSFIATYQTMIVRHDFYVFMDADEVPEPSDVILFILSLVN